MTKSNQSYSSCLAKQEKMKKLFSSCSNQEEIYIRLIELGRSLPPFDPSYKVPEALVYGCQSQMYLSVEVKDSILFFNVYSEALISAGLGALLIALYSEEPAEAILYCPPLCLQELNLQKHLSPGRANGLSSLFTKMKREALLTLARSSSFSI